jgi:hypothetical protein
VWQAKNRVDGTVRDLGGEDDIEYDKERELLMLVPTGAEDRDVNGFLLSRSLVMRTDDACNKFGPQGEEEQRNEYERQREMHTFEKPGGMLLMAPNVTHAGATATLTATTTATTTATLTATTTTTTTTTATTLTCPYSCSHVFVCSQVHLSWGGGSSSLFMASFMSTRCLPRNRRMLPSRSTSTLTSRTNKFMPLFGHHLVDGKISTPSSSATA